ncbi:MAG TPA: 4Fe-4S binding protein [Methanosphaera sp.]|nr:4Fe-4S binding protein [Methanosphaera sp.]HII09072.1 4Fe-4S binding protein [Methanosphaera sp.]HIJ16084.1 4Fe-4S binding protein [Methanosphaera sp.]
MEINIDYGKCNGLNCLECLDLCPMQVFEIKDKRVEVCREDACVGCLACQDVCSYNAISLSY